MKISSLALLGIAACLCVNEVRSSGFRPLARHDHLYDGDAGYDPEQETEEVVQMVEIDLEDLIDQEEEYADYDADDYEDDDYESVKADPESVNQAHRRGKRSGKGGGKGEGGNNNRNNRNNRVRRDPAAERACGLERIEIAAEAPGLSCQCLYVNGRVALQCVNDCPLCSDNSTACANVAFRETYANGASAFKTQISFDYRSGRRGNLFFQERFRGCSLDASGAIDFDTCFDNGRCELRINGRRCRQCNFEASCGTNSTGLIYDCSNISPSLVFDSCTQSILDVSDSYFEPLLTDTGFSTCQTSRMLEGGQDSGEIVWET